MVKYVLDSTGSEGRLMGGGGFYEHCNETTVSTEL